MNRRTLFATALAAAGAAAIPAIAAAGPPAEFANLTFRTRAGHTVMKFSDPAARSVLRGADCISIENIPAGLDFDVLRRWWAAL